RRSTGWPATSGRLHVGSSWSSSQADRIFRVTRVGIARAGVSGTRITGAGAGAARIARIARATGAARVSWMARATWLGGPTGATRRGSRWRAVHVPQRAGVVDGGLHPHDRGRLQRDPEVVAEDWA